MYSYVVLTMPAGYVIVLGCVIWHGPKRFARLRRFVFTECCWSAPMCFFWGVQQFVHSVLLFLAPSSQACSVLRSTQYRSPHKKLEFRPNLSFLLYTNIKNGYCLAIV